MLRSGFAFRLGKTLTRIAGVGTTSLANVELTALTATGAGKGASSALEAGSKVAANDAVKDLTQKASDSLVAVGGKVAKGAGTALDGARSLKGGFTDSLANAWSGSKSGVQQFARSLAGEDCSQPRCLRALGWRVRRNPGEPTGPDVP